MNKKELKQQEIDYKEMQDYIQEKVPFKIEWKEHCFYFDEERLNLIKVYKERIYYLTRSEVKRISIDEATELIKQHYRFINFK